MVIYFIIISIIKNSFHSGICTGSQHFVGQITLLLKRAASTKLFFAFPDVLDLVNNFPAALIICASRGVRTSSISKYLGATHRRYSQNLILKIIVS